MTDLEATLRDMASDYAGPGCTGSLDGICCDHPAHPDCAIAGPQVSDEEGDRK